MKRFQFTLKSVATVRAHREMLAREALASAARARAAAGARLAESALRLSEMERARTEGRSGRFRPADDVAFFHAYRRERSIESECSRQVEMASAEVETRRAACIEANRALKAIERFEAAALDAHRTAAFRAEQAEFDELAGRRSARPRHFS
jgi:flagellar export protein FliJ